MCNKYPFFGRMNIQIYWHDKKITNEYLNKLNLHKNQQIYFQMNIFVQNIQIYSNIRSFAQDCFRLVVHFHILCYFGPILNHFGPMMTIFKHFRKQLKFKYIPYHRYQTNEYTKIFVSINRSQMSIRIYSPWKKLPNI